MPTQAPGEPRKALYRVTDAMTLLSLSRSVIYEEIRAGRLRSVKRGRSRLISAAAITDYVNLLECESKAA
jgi:excisionase family DNA binding protein